MVPDPSVITGAALSRKTFEVMIADTEFWKLMLLVPVRARTGGEAAGGPMEKPVLLKVRLLKLRLSLSIVAVFVVPLKFSDTPLVRVVPPQLEASVQSGFGVPPPVQVTEGASRGSNSSTHRRRKREVLFFRVIVLVRARNSDFSQPFQLKAGKARSNSSSRRTSLLLLSALTRPKPKQFLNQRSGLRGNMTNLKMK